MDLGSKFDFENSNTLNGKLTSRLKCMNYGNIMTPFSEKEVGITGLNYVEFITKAYYYSRSRRNSEESYRFRLLVNDEEYKTLSTIIDINNNGI